MLGVITIGLAVGLTPTQADLDGLLEMFDSDSVRTQEIVKSPNEKAWPFSVERGYLTCQKSISRRQVFFHAFEEDAGEVSFKGLVVLSPRPFEMVLMNAASHHLLRGWATPEAMYSALLPYYEFGSRLCDQPRGAKLAPGEL